MNEDEKFADAMKKENEWAHSAEGIYYNIGVLSVPSNMESHILKTIYRLPDEVREFVCDECDFCNIKSGTAINLKEPRKGQWLIILYDDVAEENVENLIAHEIAHAWLKHTTVRLSHEKDLEQEKEADVTAKKWGFF